MLPIGFEALPPKAAVPEGGGRNVECGVMKECVGDVLLPMG